ncbi:MAG: histone [Candidatus Aenigmarchaeota archaeon CG_4_10_14_0_8_um_filter_37_24]|nr:histone [Candidatus Aenigmarchaeota archaeon]NCS70936.1 histone [Candidatus Aenigmarchaeota archaeon]PIY35171.1 MAG: histone [Candidatus Aenigmarchaeota archaeon CG_4_10_14_3_um_filter_37_21]PIZ33644.1 MAG: histone [Candidatus Aenigmarchaeota archaeon CG_4_10_14_0_8_um_filter_37_24]PJB74879.1 MAG: histone [Candidatus Aenigmarchaeota archaeon CG_4_9_14_3_um_filter_37_18]
MAKAKKELPLAPLERILRVAGAKRVSKSAVKEFAAVIGDYAFDLSSEASTLAKHAGRKTIIESDVRMARRKMA